MRIYPYLSPDEEFKLLEAEGLTGSINDRQAAYFTSQGFEGALPDQLGTWNSKGTSTPTLISSFPSNAFYTSEEKKSFSDVFTFARTGTATYVDNKGTLRTAADGVPRVNHFIGSTPAGLLLESTAVTNLALQSNGLDQSPWTPTATTVTPSAGTAPDGTNTAFSISHTSTAAQLQQVVSGTADVDYTVSLYVKRVDWQWFRIFADTGSAWFDLDNGVVGTSSGSIVQYDIESLGNDWFRVQVAVTASSPSFIVSLHLAASDGSGTEESGVSALVYGAQHEEGTCATSYIPTTASTATRNAETLQVDAAVMTSILGGSMPAVISIAMSGYITYADDDSPSQVKFTDWLGANGFLVNKINTASTAVGTMQFRHNDTVATVFVEAVDSYTPGLNVPFTFAVTNGASGVSAADQGVDLGNDGPRSLPDMTADDFKIGTTGNITITSLRIWTTDIETTGRVEVTS